MPVLAPVFGLLAVVGWFALIGLHYLWHYTFGWLFRTMADLLDRVGIPTGVFGTKHLFGPLSSWLRSLDRNVDHGLVSAANDLEHVAVWLFSRTGHFFSRIVSTLTGLALGVEHALAKVVRVTVPRLIRHALSFVWRELRALGRYARKMIPLLLRKIAGFAKWATHKIVAGARHLGVLWKWVRAVVALHWRIIRALVKRALRLERALLPSGFRKLLVAAFGPLGLLWLFGDSVARFGRGVLGWSYNLVSAFVRYFRKLDEPFVLAEFVAVERELTHLVLHELAFIVSEFKPERLAPPGPPFGPPA